MGPKVPRFCRWIAMATAPGDSSKEEAGKVIRIFPSGPLNAGFVDVTYLSYQAAGRFGRRRDEVSSTDRCQAVPSGKTYFGSIRLFFTFWRSV